MRQGSEQKVVAGATIVTADPFDPVSFQSFILKGSVFVQLLGVSHPSPKKAQQFKEVDLRSIKASADAAATAQVSHFIYVSIAMTPSKIMAAYQSLRRRILQKKRIELHFYKTLVCFRPRPLLASYLNTHVWNCGVGSCVATKVKVNGTGYYQSNSPDTHYFS